MSATKISNKISAIKKELSRIVSMRSGSLSQQYNVCGSPGCKCKDPVSPKKHGPYFKLKTTIGGNPTTKFVKDQNLNLVKRQLKNYKKFDDLMREWIQLANDLAEMEISSSHEKLTKKDD